MLDLPLSETVVFVLIAAGNAVAGVIATLQPLRGHARGRAVVACLIVGAVLLEILLLVLRGISLRAVPLTGLFDSLILLTLVLGVSYLLLGRVWEQIWFALVMVWLMFGTVVAAGLVAGPAARAEALAATPWAIAHGSIMVLAAASVVLATAASSLYLLGSYGLKRKKTVRVLGRIPNIETLGAMNRVGLRLGFVLLTVGVASGLRLASLLGTGLAAWLSDGKVVCILAAWFLLAAILVWDRFFVLQARVRAYVTIAAFGLILLATVGATIAGATQHKFSSCSPPVSGILAT